MANAAVEQAALLEVVAGQFGPPFVTKVEAFGAITATLGVLLNMI